MYSSLGAHFHGCLRVADSLAHVLPIREEQIKKARSRSVRAVAGLRGLPILRTDCRRRSVAFCEDEWAFEFVAALDDLHADRANVWSGKRDGEFLLETLNREC